MKLIILLLLTTATLAGCTEAGNKDKSLLKILTQLDPTCSQSDRAKAIESLRHLGTNAFPFMIEEMNSFKWHTPEEKDEEVLSRTRRLRTAFEVFGADLAPLIPEFQANLDTNRNFVSALDGFVAMGDRGAPYLIVAMTNCEPPIRLNAVAAIIKVGTNSAIAKLAVPNLLLLLNDQSALIRCVSVETVGELCAESDNCIAPLLKIALTDSDLVVRSQGVKAIGKISMRLGGMNANTKSVLEEISRQDKSDVVRLCAERVLAGKEP